MPVCDNIYGIFSTRSTAQSIEDRVCDVFRARIQSSQSERASMGLPGRLHLFVRDIFLVLPSLISSVICVCQILCRLRYRRYPNQHSRSLQHGRFDDLGAECGVEVTVEAFEEMSAINKGSKPGRFYVSMKSRYKLITAFKSKVPCWRNIFPRR